MVIHQLSTVFVSNTFSDLHNQLSTIFLFHTFSDRMHCQFKFDLIMLTGDSELTVVQPEG